MSGIITGNETDDVILHYYQRFNEINQKNPNKSLATSTVGSISESTANGQYFNSKGQSVNGTLSTDQFYKKNFNQDHRIQAENIPSTQHLMEGSSTCGGENNSSVFKRPLPVKRFNCRPHIERRLDFVVEGFRSIKDKPTLKFLITTNETLLHAIKNPPAQPVNPVHLIDYVSNLVKEEYFSKRVPKSICGSSVMSDQASNIDQSGNSERSIRLDKPTGTVPISESRVVLEDITQLSMHRGQCNRPPQGLNNSEYSSIGRTGLSYHHQQETSTRSEAARKRGRLSPAQRLLDTLAGSTFNLLNDTEIAQRRDEAAAGQGKSHADTVVPKKSGKTLVKSTPKPTMNSSKVSRVIKASAAANKKPSNERSKVAVPVSETCLLDHSNRNISLLNGTANGISRSGRTLRCPIKYWNARGEELSCDIDESVLNESMTLRNKKVLDKKKTPPIRGCKTNTPPVPIITDNKVSKPSTTKNPRGRPPNSGKKNIDAERKKPVKKPTDTPMVKSASSKGKTNKKKEEVANQNTKKTVKKPAPKRKSKESNDITSKKKKVEDPIPSDVEEGDDIFGTVTYRKITHQNLKVALSPSAALLSAKKAAGEAQGKATPPCKAIGDMMANESIQSMRSAAKEAPKQSWLKSRSRNMSSTMKSKRDMLNEAVKRTIKKMEKDKFKAPTLSKAKTQVKKSREDDAQLNDLMEAAKSTFSVENPVCSATLTLFRGNSRESDLSDMDQDDGDDEDDDDDLM